jgi:hypothetical protein
MWDGAYFSSSSLLANLQRLQYSEETEIYLRCSTLETGFQLYGVLPRFGKEDDEAHISGKSEAKASKRWFWPEMVAKEDTIVPLY